MQKSIFGILAAALAAGPLMADTVIWYPSGVHTLSIGGTSNNPCYIHGNYDELRVSEGVLPTSAFLRALPNCTMVIVR